MTNFDEIIVMAWCDKTSFNDILPGDTWHDYAHL